jgi:hypothetical protein
MYQASKKRSRALSSFSCIACGQIIHLDGNVCNEKGRLLALDENGEQLHNCQAQTSGGKTSTTSSKPKDIGKEGSDIGNGNMRGGGVS